MGKGLSQGHVKEPGQDFFLKNVKGFCKVLYVSLLGSVLFLGNRLISHISGSSLSSATFASIQSPLLSSFPSDNPGFSVWFCSCIKSITSFRSSVSLPVTGSISAHEL